MSRLLPGIFTARNNNISTGGTVYDRVEFVNAPIARAVTLMDTAGTRLDRINDFEYPRLTREESTGNSPGGNSVSGQAHRMLKWDYHHAQLGGNSKIAQIQALHPEILSTVYFPWVETQMASSPFYKNGSGGRFSHQQYFDGFGLSSVGGKPSGGTGTGPSNYDLFPGHCLVSFPMVTTQDVTALTGSGNTKTVQVTGGTSHIPVGSGDSNRRTCIIYTPHNSSTHWRAEASTSTPYSDAEAIVITAKTSTSITYKQLRTDAGDLFKSMGGNGSVAHGQGSRIVLVGKGQASRPRSNFRFNPSQTYCPRDGNNKTWGEFHVEWMAANYKVNSNGNATSVVKNMIASDVTDVTLSLVEDYNIKGDGSIDHYHHNNDNIHRQGMEEIAGLIAANPVFAGMPIQHGGVREMKLLNTDASQSESLTDGQDQHGDDEDLRFYEIAGFGDRMKNFANRFSTFQPMNTAVIKSEARYARYSGNTSNQNNAIINQLALTVIFGGTLAIRDLPTTGERPNNNDNWLEEGGVISDANNLQGLSLGDAIENTDANQNLINSNKRWLGHHVSDIFNISGVDLESTTPVATQNFPSIGSVGGWTVGGNNTGSTSLSYNSATQSLRADNIKGDPNWGAVFLRSPAYFDTADANKDYVIRIIFRSSSIGTFQAQVGQSNKHNIEIYPAPGVQNEITICGTFGSASTEFPSGSINTGKLRLEAGRVNDSITSNSWLDIERVDVWVGNNLRNTAWGRYTSKGGAFSNATNRTITYDLEGDFIVPATSSLHGTTWAPAGGSTINQLVMPPNCGIVMPRAANNYPFVSSNWNPQTNTATLLVPAGQGSNYGSYVNMGGIVRTPVVTQNVAA